nr:MAG TPA: SSXT protein [Bacteriophage sp.]
MMVLNLQQTILLTSQYFQKMHKNLIYHVF